MKKEAKDLKILLITTIDSSYPGADTVGQARLQYPSNTLIIRVPDPVLFPESFYLNSFEKGIDGIIIMSSGSDSKFKGSYEKLAARLNKVYILMKEKNIPIDKLRMTTICTVCKASFIKEVNQMQTALLNLN